MDHRDVLGLVAAHSPYAAARVARVSREGRAAAGPAAARAGRVARRAARRWREAAAGFAPDELRAINDAATLLALLGSHATGDRGVPGRAALKRRLGLSPEARGPVYRSLRSEVSPLGFSLLLGARTVSARLAPDGQVSVPPLVFRVRVRDAAGARLAAAEGVVAAALRAVMAGYTA